ncbi:acyl-ACP thioesterase domain-containing protein [Anaerovorax odorimutans]|uniref:acyl-ACP thioesterase domain-containing protein n=1 Tax=Anaerovorax odorimutans TaxID=109327 RepID=UPI00146E3638|nr:acyl-ACP thioesterase domain-containing protein [Anaerovorax odorimutans]
MTEKERVYQLETTVSFFNQYSQLKPYAYQILFEQMAEKHLSDLNVNVDSTIKYGLAWALISMSVEILKPIEPGMTLYGNTWYSQHKGPYFRRELLFKNNSGDIMFQGSTYSVLLDVEKRSIFRKKEVPFPMVEPTEGILLDASPNFKTNMTFKPIIERVVFPSYIDCVGHVNNCRYGEFAYDIFTPEEQENLKQLKRMDIYFLSELRNSDYFNMERAYDGEQILIRGYNKTKDDVSFNIVMSF